MPSEYHRERPEGRVHRARLRALVVPMLRVGLPVPGSSLLANLLGIHPSEAGRHMRRVLDEDGIATETHGRGRGRRIYVTGMGYNGNAGQGMVPTGVSREQRDEQDRAVPAVDSGPGRDQRQDRGEDTPAVGQGASPDQSRAGSRPSDSLQHWRAAA